MLIVVLEGKVKAWQLCVIPREGWRHGSLERGILYYYLREQSRLPGTLEWKTQREWEKETLHFCRVLRP